MTVHASTLLPAIFDASLQSVLATLQGHDEKALLIEYAGQTVRPGYHVTEVKAGSFSTLDCGGNPDSWQETILQIEDLPANNGETYMKVGKFLSILGQVARKVSLNKSSRLTFEIGPPEKPMQVFDVAEVAISPTAATIRLGARPAICKPRHRAVQELVASACCGPKSAATCCA